MIAVDTNILVHAHRRDSSSYGLASRALNTLVAGRETWAIPWPCLHEFLAVVTNARTFRPPTTLSAALEQVDAWLAAPNLVLLAEADAHWSLLADVLRSGRITGGLVHDARIVALCHQHGVRELWTADRDFTRFAGLATFNPLEDDRVHETPPTYAAAKRARAAGRRRSIAEPFRPGLA